jgi:hypothetical protein
MQLTHFQIRITAKRGSNDAGQNSKFRIRIRYITSTMIVVVVAVPPDVAVTVIV